MKMALVSAVLAGIVSIATHTAIKAGVLKVDVDIPKILKPLSAGQATSSEESEEMTASDELAGHQAEVGRADRQHLAAAKRLGDAAQRAENLHVQTPVLEARAREEKMWLQDNRRVATSMMSDYTARLASVQADTKVAAAPVADNRPDWLPCGVVQLRSRCNTVFERVQMNRHGELQMVSDGRPVTPGAVVWDNAEAHKCWKEAAGSRSN
jgi:hypothetical protein